MPKCDRHHFILGANHEATPLFHFEFVYFLSLFCSPPIPLNLSSSKLFSLANSSFSGKRAVQCGSPRAVAVSSITSTGTRIETCFIRSPSFSLRLPDSPLEVSLHAAMAGNIRNCSSHSLSSLSLPRPEPAQDHGKRRLLLIYIHGFMGSEASFHDLPAHIHDLLTGILGESHIVYTRIYPRYKSHGELRTAVEQFSNWYVALNWITSRDPAHGHAGYHHMRQMI